MKLSLDNETKDRLKLQALEEKRSPKKQAEFIIEQAVCEVELPKRPAGFGRKAK